MPQYQPGLYWMSEPRVGTAETSKKTPYFFIEGPITHTGQGEETVAVPVSETRTVFMYLSEKASGYTMDKLEALGFNGDFSNPRLSDEHMAGLWVQCAHEMYEGKLKEKWNLPGGGIEHAPVSIDAVRKMNAVYKSRKASSGKKAAPPAPKKPAPAATVTDEDIPRDENGNPLF